MGGASVKGLSGGEIQRAGSLEDEDRRHDRLFGGKIDLQIVNNRPFVRQKAFWF
jgi:hypothetical protein